MRSAGASVLTGITLTKLVGVSVLAIAPSLLFRVYYFRMYMATVFAGAFQVLACASRPLLVSVALVIDVFTCELHAIHASVAGSRLFQLHAKLYIVTVGQVG